MATNVEPSHDLPSRASWVLLSQASSVWSDIFKAPLPPHSNLNAHPALLRQSGLDCVPSPDVLVAKPNWIAVKRVDLGLKRYPHNVKKEAEFLRRLDHPNIVPLLGSTYTSPTFSLYIPLYVLTLTSLLHSSKPQFTPSLPAFYFLSRHILRQLASGLAYLHDRGVAHRDVGPSNVLFDQSGTAVWIDFGTAWSADIGKEEAADGLEFELGTMPYRAPELLFGSRHYSPFALDCWALGVLLAELFTPLTPGSPKPQTRAQSRPAATGEIEPLFSFGLDIQNNGSALDCYTPPVAGLAEDELWTLPDLPGGMRAGSEENWQQDHQLERKTLFVGHLGDIGLVGSIFKILGTPDVSTWPEAENLPDFSKLTFHSYPPQPLENVLPYTKPECERHQIDEKSWKEIIKLISSLLVYQSTDRLTVSQVLSHSWLESLEDEYDGMNYREWMEPWLTPSTPDSKRKED